MAKKQKKSKEEKVEEKVEEKEQCEACNNPDCQPIRRSLKGKCLYE